MGTKSIGKGTRNISVNVPVSLYMEISRLASVSGCKMGEYVRTVLQDSVRRSVLIRENPGDRAEWESAVVREDTPPKIKWEVAPLSPGKAQRLTA